MVSPNLPPLRAPLVDILTLAEIASVKVRLALRFFPLAADCLDATDTTGDKRGWHPSGGAGAPRALDYIWRRRRDGGLENHVT
jgi:hypothetical protein